MSEETTPQTVTAETLQEQLPTPESSQMTHLLNGMGNGAMLAGAAAYAVKFGTDLIIRRKLPTIGEGFVLGITALGGVWGAMHGMREGAQINNYRRTVSNEVGLLREKTAEQERNLKALKDALDAKERGSEPMAAAR